MAITGYDELGRTNLQTNPTFNVPATTNGTSTTQYDALGRVIKQTDQMGNDTWYCYNDLPTVGQSTGPTGLCYIPTVPALPAHNYKFTGKERDSESGLDYFGARYYNSNVGRWTIPDWSAKAEPVPYSKLDNPQSLNLYAYVGNNPITQVDADGHEGGAGAATLTLADAWAAGRAASVAGPEAAVSTFVAVGWAALAANAEPSSGMTVPGYGPEVTPSNNLGNIFTRGNSAQNAKTGEPPQLKAGKEAHKNEPVRPGEQKEVKTADGKGRMDRYDSKKSHIREIKPNNSRGQSSGTKQLEQYKAAQEQATGKPHTTELTLYDPKK